MWADVSAEERKIKIAADEWPPFEYALADGTPAGFSVEVTDEVLKMMNVKSEIEFYPWARAEMMIINGYADMLLSGVYSQKRAEEAFYPAEPLVDSSWAIFILKEREGEIRYETLDDLKKYRIGIVRAYAYPQDFLDSARKFRNVEEVGSDLSNIKKLLSKRVDCIVMNYHNGENLLELTETTEKIIPLSKKLAKSPIYPIFSKKTWISQEFVDEFSLKLIEFKKTSKYQEIYTKYLGEY